MIKIIRTAASLAGSLMGGGVTALFGTLGAFGGESVAMIWKEVLDYTYFDAENGYLKDHPERKDESVATRLRRTLKDD